MLLGPVTVGYTGLPLLVVSLSVVSVKCSQLQCKYITWNVPELSHAHFKLHAIVRSPSTLPSPTWDRNRHGVQHLHAVDARHSFVTEQPSWKSDHLAWYRRVCVEVTLILRHHGPSVQE